VISKGYEVEEAPPKKVLFQGFLWEHLSSAMSINTHEKLVEGKN
jgi:hypothetical protein